MTIAEMQAEIRRLKQEKNVCILAHTYQSQDIWEVADYVGDSYGLSVQAAGTDADAVIMCGVRFMAETCKILAPDKRVYLANGGAGCPMADQLDAELVRALKREYPGYAVVCYINTTAETKTECDVCVTSSSAQKVIGNMEADRILFIPDCNLGDYVAKQLPDKTFRFVHGGCPTHLRITPRDVETARRLHPDAEILVHPECHPSVTALADYVGSTSGILAHAEAGDRRAYVIGTENSIVQHLQFSCPDKAFYALSGDTICRNMKLTTLGDVLGCLRGAFGEEITLDEPVLNAAKRCIDAMLRLSQ